MGQKINPVGLRLQVNRTWDSRWFADGDEYGRLLHEDLAIRDRVLGWAAGMADDREWFIQKAVAWWLRDLSKHDATRARAWLAAHGPGLRAFARKEAARHLAD